MIKTGQRHIIRLKVPVPVWGKVAGESIMADVVSMDDSRGTITYRAIGSNCDRVEATFMARGDFLTLANGSPGKTEGGLDDRGQGKLL